MLFDCYEFFFFNSNFKEVVSVLGFVVYCGEFIFKEGEVVDIQGCCKLLIEVFKQVILLVEGDDLKLIVGLFDELQQFEFLFNVVGVDFKVGMLVVFFIVNILKFFIVMVNGVMLVFILLVQGMVWIEFSDLVVFDKGDFKGQGVVDKVVMVYNVLKSNKFKFFEMSIEQVLEMINDVKCIMYGVI